METVDQHRGILHGGKSGKNYYDDAFMIDLVDKVSGKLQIVLAALINDFFLEMDLHRFPS